jgi:hypothetical protein
MDRDNVNFRKETKEKGKKIIMGPSKRSRMPLPKCTAVPWYRFFVPGTNFSGTVSVP